VALRSQRDEQGRRGTVPQALNEAIADFASLRQTDRSEDLTVEARLPAPLTPETSKG
jgi:hypothetical protein